MNQKKLFKSHKMCCVSQCTNRCSEVVSLHTFPQSETLKREWSRIIGKVPSPFSVVCSEHFKPENFHFPRYPISFRKRLKANALPSQNIPVKIKREARASKAQERATTTSEFSSTATGYICYAGKCINLKDLSAEKVSIEPIKREIHDSPLEDCFEPRKQTCGGSARELICHHCGFSTLKKSTLRDHVMFKHSKVKPFTCSHCSYCAATKSSIKQHIILKH